MLSICHLVDFLQNLGLFLVMVSGYKQSFLSVYFCFSSVQCWSEIQLFRLRIAVNAIGLVHYWPGSLVSRQIYHQPNPFLRTYTSHLPNLVKADWKDSPGDLSQSEKAKYFE